MKVDAYGASIENETVTEIYITSSLCLFKTRDGTVGLEIEGEEYDLDLTDMELLSRGLDTALSYGWGLPAVRGVEENND